MALSSISPRSILYKMPRRSHLSRAQDQPSGPSRVEDPRADVEQLYREHRPWLIRFLERRFSGIIAEDVVQEAFARVIRLGGPARNPRAFLVRVAVNAALTQAQQTHPQHLEAPQWALDWVRTEADQQEALLLRQLILKLPPDLREVFLLSRFGGLSNVEIAHRCNLSVKRVEARITKARAMCTALMQD